MRGLKLHTSILWRFILVILYSTGRVLTCKDGVVSMAGLWDSMAGEVVMSGRNSVMGVVSNLASHSFSAVVLGSASAILSLSPRYHV